MNIPDVWVYWCMFKCTISVSELCDTTSCISKKKLPVVDLKTNDWLIMFYLPQEPIIDSWCVMIAAVLTGNCPFIMCLSVVVYYKLLQVRYLQAGPSAAQHLLRTYHHHYKCNHCSYFIHTVCWEPLSQSCTAFFSTYKEEYIMLYVYCMQCYCTVLLLKLNIYPDTVMTVY